MSLDLNLVATLPVLVPLAAAVLVLLLDAALPGQRVAHLLLAAGGLLAGAVGTVPGLLQGPGDRRGSFCLESGECLYAASRLTSALQVAALLAALVVLVLAWRDWAAPGGGGGFSGSPDRAGRTPVLAALVLGATGGVAAVPAAGDLGTLLIGLELATLPTVALVVLVRTTWAGERRARAVEGGVALLTTSLVSFALLALGAALWVAATGTALLGGGIGVGPDPAGAVGAAGPDDAVRAAGALGAVDVAGAVGAAGAFGTVVHPPLLVLAAIFLVAGLAFKVSAVPFHAWTPITYTAAPLPVAAYLATVSKIAALGGLVVVIRALGTVDDTTLLAVAVLAATSMTLGNLVALTQTDTVRLLAWSTVAQAGWVLLPLVSLSSRAAHAAGSYLVVYVVATLLAFVVVAAVAGIGAGPRPSGAPADGAATDRAAIGGATSGGAATSVASPGGSAPGPDTSLTSHQGLLRTHPLLAVPLALALLTLAGLPPAIAGVVAKIVALRPVLGGGTEWIWLALVAAVNIALGIAVYLRWLAVVVGTVRGSPGESRAVRGDRDAMPRTIPVAVWVLVAVLTTLLVAGSIVPVGII